MGCVLGNYLIIIGSIADAEGLGYFETFTSIDPVMAIEFMKMSFDPIDLLFYAFALFAGWSFSSREIDEEDFLEQVAE